MANKANLIPDNLSPRETDLYPLLLSGMMVREIALSLGLRHATVRNQVVVLYSKCGVACRTELMAQEIERLKALVPDDEDSTET